jgi:hypothetical protein
MLESIIIMINNTDLKEFFILLICIILLLGIHLNKNSKS